MTKHHNECCSHLKRCRYAVGSNMPGYMPDNLTIGSEDREALVHYASQFYFGD